MPFWRRKTAELPPPAAASPVAVEPAPPAAAPVDRIDSETLNFLSNVVALEAMPQKTFDWNHYMAMVGGNTSSLFVSEFNLIPTSRIIKAQLVAEPWINACTRAISKQFQSVRFILKRKRTKDGVKVQVITEHPLLEYLHSAGKEVEASSAFYSNIVADLVLPGNAYWWNSEDLSDKRRIPAERIEPYIENNAVTSYRLLDRTDLALGGTANVRLELTPEEITHIKLPNPFTPHFGLSMVVAVTLPVLIEKYGREYVVGFFLRGGTTSGIIETETSNVEQLMRLARTLMQAFGGRKNAHADKILPKGATWKGQGQGFSDIGLVELLKDNVGHFRAATGCTNTVLGIVENIVYATARAEMELFWKQTILPMQGILCDGIKSSSIWSRFGVDDGFELAIDNSMVEWLDEVDKLLDRDAKLASIATINERRQRLAMPEIARFGDKLAAEVVRPQLPGTPGGADPGAAGAAGAAVAADNAVTAPQVSLNGAQVSSMIDVITAVAAGKLPRESGIAILQTAFALSSEQAAAIMGTVGAGFEPAADAPPPAAPPPPEAPPPEEPPQKALPPLVGDDLVRWKAAELAMQEPGPAIVSLFREEFRAWEGIVLANLQHRSLAGAAIMKRADEFARGFAAASLEPVMRAYDHQLDRARAAAKAMPAGRRGIRTKDTAEERAARLALLRERAAQVIEDGIFSSGRRGFVGYSETAMDNVYAFIEAELAAGKSLADVASSVRTQFAESYGTGEAYKGQAETIVRTEYASAVSIGQARFGSDLASVTARMAKSWVTMGDDHVRASHDEAEAASPIEGDSSDVPNAPFPNGLAYPREAGAAPADVVNCFIGSTKVVAPVIRKAFQRLYAGPLVSIVLADGTELSGTPNHPMLTAKGWVALGALREGDELLKARPLDHDAAAGHEINRIPTSISEIFATLAKTRHQQRRAGRVLDFHGDGCKTDVQIVAADSELKDIREPASRQATGEIDLEPTDLDEARLTADSRAHEPLLISGAASDGGIRRGDLTPSRSDIHSAPFDQLRIATAPPTEAESAETAADRRARNIEALRQCLDAHGFMDVQPVQLAKLVVSENATHVFNLETDSGLYLAEGIITHNCRCSIVYDAIEWKD